MLNNSSCEKPTQSEIDEIKRKVEEGDAYSMLLYGHFLANGLGVPADKKEAARYFKIDADQGLRQACFEYAQMLFNGDGIEMNVMEGIHYCKLAADKNDPYCAMFYACMLFQGQNV